MEEQTAIDEILRRTAEEMRRCRDVVLHLETVIHTLIETGGAQASAGPLAKLQAVDLLDQMLHDLVLWVEGLAGQASGTLPVGQVDDLARRMRLADMRHRLAGHVDSRTMQSGHAEFF